MSSSLCSRCLLRVSQSIALTSTTRAAPIFGQTSSFHSSAARHDVLKKKSGRPTSVQARQSQSARLKKKAREAPKPPPVGERRAQRRRIVLSNTNALAIPEMQTWTRENMTDTATVGQVVALDGPLLDQLRDASAFKRTQSWGLFRRPATLIRTETIALARDVDEVTRSEGPKTCRHLIVGDRASGKSILALQAMSLGYMNSWLVLNVPEGQELVNNTSSYMPMHKAKAQPTTDGEQQYIQPGLTQLLLKRALYSNDKLLQSLKMNHAPAEVLRLEPNATLKDLVQCGVDDQHLAWPCWTALWREISQPGRDRRPPVLVAADGVDHWMGPSKYRDAEFNIIHAQQLSLVRQFSQLLAGGTSPFVNGGMVVFASSASNTPSYPTFNLLVSQLRARSSSSSSSPTIPLPKPYSKPDPRILELAAGMEQVQLTDLEALSLPETRGYLDYLARSGVLSETLTDRAVAEFRGLSGGGVVGELVRLGTRVRL